MSGELRSIMYGHYFSVLFFVLRVYQSLRYQNTNLDFQSSYNVTRLLHFLVMCLEIQGSFNGQNIYNSHQQRQFYILVDTHKTFQICFTTIQAHNIGPYTDQYIISKTIGPNLQDNYSIITTLLNLFLSSPALCPNVEVVKI